MKIAKLNNAQSLPTNKRRIRGQGMTEYIIIVALIAIAAIGVVGAFGGVIQEQFAVISLELAGGDSTQSRTDATNAGTAAGTAATTSTLSDFEN